MLIKEISRWDLPTGYKSDYPNNEYTPDLSATNLKTVIEKVNEIVKVVNQIGEVKVLQKRNINQQFSSFTL